MQGSGALDQRLQGRLDIALNRLGQLWPQLFGRLEGRLDLAGSLAAPQGRLNLKGQQIAYAEQRIAGLDLQANLDARQNGTLALVASGLRSGETDLGLFKATPAATNAASNWSWTCKVPCSSSAWPSTGNWSAATGAVAWRAAS